MTNQETTVTDELDALISEFSRTDSNLPNFQYIEGKVITQPNHYGVGGDGITVFGEKHPLCRARKTIIRNVIIDFRQVPLEEQDEAISGVRGARVDMENVIIIGAKKAMLCGNGDFPESDKKYGSWNLRNVAFINCGRRCPEVQDGVSLKMKNVLIENWGKTFDERSFGLWAHKGGVIEADNVVFVQKNWKSNFFKDLISHIGMAFNEKDKLPTDYITPGCCRGSSQTAKGNVFLSSIYRNSPFIRLQGLRDKPLPVAHGMSILANMMYSFMKSPTFYANVRARCAGSVLIGGLA